MTIPFYCVFFSFVWIYVAKLPVGIAMKKLGGYDNRHGREQQKKLTGWGHRSLAAHMNGFESFGGFAAMVIVAHLCGA